MSCKADSTNKDKCLITLELAKFKTALEVAKYDRHITPKKFRISSDWSVSCHDIYDIRYALSKYDIFKRCCKYKMPGSKSTFNMWYLSLEQTIRKEN